MADKIPATGKWEDGSKDPGRLANEQLGDMEFGQAVAPYMDPEDRQYIKPEQAKLVPLRGQSNLSGTNMTRETEPRTYNIDPELHPEGKDKLTLQPGNIYAMSAEDANPQLFAHEFRHESPSIRARLGRTEKYNRYEDLYHAMTTKDDDEAMAFLADLLHRESGPESPYGIEDDYGEARQEDGYWMDQARELRPAIMKQFNAWHEGRVERQEVDRRLTDFFDDARAKKLNSPPDEHKKPMGNQK